MQLAAPEMRPNASSLISLAMSINDGGGAEGAGGECQPGSCWFALPGTLIASSPESGGGRGGGAPQPVEGRLERATQERESVSPSENSRLEKMLLSLASGNKCRLVSRTNGAFLP